MKQLCDACAEHLADEASMTQLLQMYHNTLRSTSPKMAVLAAPQLATAASSEGASSYL